MKKNQYKIVVLGDSGSGKTALVKRFVRNEVVVEYDPTIEDKYTKKLYFQNKTVGLEIVDTSGKELLPDMLTRYILFADAFIICYSVSSHRSFQRAIELFDRIERQRNISNIARVLVGCKCDIDYREVHPDEGNELSAQLQCSFAETSAHQNLNIAEVFDECISQLNYIEILRNTPGPSSFVNNSAVKGTKGGFPARVHHPTSVNEQWYPTKGSNFCCFL